MLNLLRKSSARQRDGQRFHENVVAQARQPVFFRDFGVPDTIDGRFDMVTLHGWLAVAALKQAGQDQAAQGLTDALFIGFDEAMREQGTGDMGLGRKMKAFAEAFYGRVAAYGAAQDEAALALALARNLYRGAPVDGRSEKLAAYAFAAKDSLARGLPDALDFGPLPAL